MLEVAPLLYTRGAVIGITTLIANPSADRLAADSSATHLAPGGVLVTPPEELRSRFRQHRVQGETHTRGDRSVTTVQVDFDPDPTDSSFEATLVFLIRQAGQPLQVEADTHVVGLFDLNDVLSTLREVGFEPRAEPWDLPPDLLLGEDLTLITAIKRPTG